MQRHASVIDEALEKLPEQLGVQATDGISGELNIHVKPRPAGKVDHHPRECFIKGYIGVTIAVNAALIANGFKKSLA